MAITSAMHHNGVRVVTMNYPPVNALPVTGWFAIADAMNEASADAETRVVVLRAEGRGFNAGVDIKEMQDTSGFDRPARRESRLLPRLQVDLRMRCSGRLGGERLLSGRESAWSGARTPSSRATPAYFRGSRGRPWSPGRSHAPLPLVPAHLLRALYFTRPSSASRYAFPTRTNAVVVIPSAMLGQTNCKGAE
ncbi:MAG: enoyl-CoA hydratase-related protein [Galbitalea sp.]